ncbi:aldose epimerase family protein [Colwellia sp. 1_MG-2023]|uniref:aldose epimerase family protein n=1 Tax=Colwellia sp. 1_MG-2023 TaxID=3062649 RepID=UPI0026E2E49B|nr:aldose epimerase family protein [Colwellia sp. 1_MG-2023]MDO6444181.1 aldose epimerase family protein [Colwellia sp. 1_MG-2023]
MKSLKVFRLQNQNGMRVEIVNFGARIKSILFPVCGKGAEMTVGYSDPVDYLNDPFYLGAICGRVANRIENAKFEINGEAYVVSSNEAPNCLHGGEDNFSLRYWELIEASDNSVKLSLVSPNGDQGFPGDLIVTVTYQLTEENELSIDFNAKSNKATPISLTNHAYFNLGDKTCESLKLQIHAQYMLDRKSNGLPSAEIVTVENTDFDFNSFKHIGESQNTAKNKLLKKMRCYDHCFVLNRNENKLKASLVSHQNNVQMNVYTDQLAIQLYTGVGLSGPFIPYQGVCLEAQNYSNAINLPHFPERILQPENVYQKNITFEFLAI